jgi:hypothetical protein
MMRPAIVLAFLITLLHSVAFFPGFASAQSQPQPQTQQKVPPKAQQKAAAIQSSQTDEFGMTCAQILQMSSADWVAHFNEAAAEKPAASPAKSGAANVPARNPADKTIRAIAAYGKCYDARTDRLAASLAKSGKGPLMGARGNFRDFEQAVQSFTVKALADSQPPADAVKSAYAALYEKQFRYEFYEAYDQQGAKPAATPSTKTETKTGSTAAPPPPIAAPIPSSAPSTKSTPAAASTTGAAGATTTPPAAAPVDPVTIAKNDFGGLLADLPDDKMHELHAAFGDILVRNSVGASMQLSLYRYAIFLIEPPPAAVDSGQASTPPPF